MNKYEKLVEEINKKEAIVEQKDNLAEQLQQLTNKYNEYLKAESELLKKHHQAMQTMLKQNIVECREVIHESDGIYFSRKQSLWLLISYMTFFGIIIVEIFYFVTKWLE